MCEDAVEYEINVEADSQTNTLTIITICRSMVCRKQSVAAFVATLQTPIGVWLTLGVAGTYAGV